MLDMTSHLNTLNKSLQGKRSMALQILECFGIRAQIDSEMYSEVPSLTFPL